jgi:hypothetical protein
MVACGRRGRFGEINLIPEEDKVQRITTWLMNHVFDREGARHWREIEVEWTITTRRVRELERQVQGAMDVPAVEARIRKQYPELFM